MLLSSLSRKAAVVLVGGGNGAGLVRLLGGRVVAVGRPSAASNASRRVVIVRSYKSDDSNDNKNDDPFGVKYQDGTEKLGPKSEFPPRYVRDQISGKLTGDTEIDKDNNNNNNVSATTEEEEETSQIMKRILAHWSSSDGDDDSSSEEVNLKEDAVARRIRRETMALNTVGRRVSDVSRGAAVASDDGVVSANLSPNEYGAWQAHNNDDDDLPWTKTTNNDSNNNDLDDILPIDLAPPRPLNRREAKPLPKKLLHHNNLALLGRYVTPGGQISNRVQSRLGAKDQRKIAKLIKRARHLGLIPFVGQYRYEDHGDLHEEDLDEQRPWELQLEKRGLVIRRDEPMVDGDE